MTFYDLVYSNLSTFYLNMVTDVSVMTKPQKISLRDRDQTKLMVMYTHLIGFAPMFRILKCFSQEHQRALRAHRDTVVI